MAEIIDTTVGPDATIQAQRVTIHCKAPYICYHLLKENEREWCPQPDSDWRIHAAQRKTADMIIDARFGETDIVTPWSFVVAGYDASSNKNLLVMKNGVTANFEATGTTTFSKLNYVGLSSMVDGKEEWIELAPGYEMGADGFPFNPALEDEAAENAAEAPAPAAVAV